MATQNGMLSALIRVATQIWNHRASSVCRGREDKADELWFELLKGLV
jgi:hypothetical protein